MSKAHCSLIASTCGLAIILGGIFLYLDPSDNTQLTLSTASTNAKLQPVVPATVRVITVSLEKDYNSFEEYYEKELVVPELVTQVIETIEMSGDVKTESISIKTEPLKATSSTAESISTKEDTSSSILQKFSGYYEVKNKDADNFDKYLAAVGVPFLLRFAGRGIKQDIRFTHLQNDRFQIETVSFIKNSNDIFELNTPRVFPTMDMRTVNGTWTSSRNPPTLHLLETWGTKSGTQDWSIDSNGQLTLTLCCNDICSNRIYQRSNQ